MSLADFVAQWRYRNVTVRPKLAAGFSRRVPMTKRKSQAHAAVAKALRKGLLTAGKCEQCDFPKAIAHHDDYLRPLDVRWLCRVCHRAWHSQHGEAANP